MKPKSIQFAAAALVLVPVLGMAQSVPVYTVTTIVGTNVGGYSGDGAAANAAQLSTPTSVFVDSKGVLYIADQANARIRSVSSGNISTVAGTGVQGYSGDKAAATSAQVNAPDSVFVDSSGKMYISDTANHAIRQVSGGTITTYVGSGQTTQGYGGDGGSPTSLQVLLNRPTGIVLDSSGNLYFSDTFNNRIRKVSNNLLSTIAGGATGGYTGNGGPATVAHLNNPRALALGPDGALYIADSGSNMIRKIVNGTITLVAGDPSAVAGFSGDNGQAVGAKLWKPEGVAVDSCSNVYIADTNNSRIRMITAAGVITTIAGNGTLNYSGDNGPATSAQFFYPAGVAVDSKFNVYVADTQNNVIRLLTPSAPPPCGVTPPVIKANGVISASGFGAFNTIAPGTWIEIYGSNLAADTRSWKTSDFNGVNAPTSLDRTTVTIGGQSAFVAYINNGQVNAQVPSNIGTGSLPVTVGTAGGTSTINVNVANLQPGLFAPPLFLVNGKQYVGATTLDGGTFIAPPGSIPGVTSRQAKPGETIIFYGIGFGPVDTNVPAGQIVTQANHLVNPVSISFGSSQATLSYYGLAGNFVGLYEFYATVPNVPDSDLVPITFSLNGVAGTQTLYTAVKH